MASPSAAPDATTIPPQVKTILEQCHDRFFQHLDQGNTAKARKWIRVISRILDAEDHTSEKDKSYDKIPEHFRRFLK